MSERRILITGAGGPAGWNVISSLRLSKSSMAIFGTDINPYHLEYTREYLNNIYLVPRCTEPDYIDKINEIIDENDIELVHSQPDIEVSVMSENRDRLHAKLFYPSKETVRICQDKKLSADVWKKAGFKTLQAIELRPDHLEEDIDKAFEILGNNIWIRATKGAGGTGSTPATSKETAMVWIRYWLSRGKSWHFIAQENLTGRNYAFQSVWKDGELITSQARERLEYIYPYLAPSGITGTPVVARTVINDAVNEVATKSILAIDSNATGVFCCDLKEDKDGNPLATEINVGRFFTTSYFFSYAGHKLGRWYANMPLLMVKLALDEPIPDLDKIPKYNALPEGWLWIRHIDCGHHLVHEKDIQRS
ncbi:MAG: hypothetical protein ACTSWN_07755 [Promethearchaeota archaeon]